MEQDYCESITQSYTSVSKHDLAYKKSNQWEFRDV